MACVTWILVLGSLPPGACSGGPGGPGGRDRPLEGARRRRQLLRPQRQPRLQFGRQIRPEPLRCGQHPGPDDQRPSVAVRRPLRPRQAGEPLRRPRPGAFPAMVPAAPVRHRRRAAGEARPRLRPAARRQVGVAARIAVAQRAVAPLHGRLPRQHDNGVRGRGGAGRGCDRGHLRSWMPEVSLDVLTHTDPPAPARLPLGRAATPRQLTSGKDSVSV